MCTANTIKKGMSMARRCTGDDKKLHMWKVHIIQMIVLNNLQSDNSTASENVLLICHTLTSLGAEKK